ncbi:uncharacterized protein LOC117233231 [Bombus vosnesenskii]|uniref:Uncharacterized protein LOC117233231 n=1 Tax=Bombus vosnesenskii TaxID=207650 RepID=A0A6J3KB24_9HYME|nr:uncharacterized protein LOC117233231 [Bombus vosnesenskii]
MGNIKNTKRSVDGWDRVDINDANATFKSSWRCGHIEEPRRGSPRVIAVYIQDEREVETRQKAKNARKKREVQAPCRKCATASRFTIKTNANSGRFNENHENCCFVRVT